MTDISYINWSSMSDKALVEHIGAFVRHHRIEQNLTQSDLASKSGISRSTLSLLERGETVTTATLIQVLRVLDLLHVMNAFEVQNPSIPHGPEKEKRQRTGRKKINEKNNFNKEDDWLI